MGTKIKFFLDGTFLEYDRGKFDNWCVYMNSNETRQRPSDSNYFEQLQKFSKVYGVDKVYQDYIKVYNLVGKAVNNSDLKEISQIASTYGKDALEMDKIFSILYMVMIAEERKAYTKLGKRIKRLGIYKLLLEEKTVSEAANFMRGMNWRDIDKLCRERGF